MPAANPTPAATAPPRTQLDDRELLPYVLANEIGRGSFANVYRGYHEVSRDQVAVKIVSRSILTTKLFENLQSEIEILKRLHHRHITQLIDIIRAERNIYLIMEFCAGGDLSIYIKRRGKVEGLSYIPSPDQAPIYYPHPKSGGLDEVVVRAFLRQLARALKFLRFHNLIHRDIKPQNLLLTPASDEDFAKGHPIGVPLLKLADFGFARVLPNATLAETLCGSPLYMAPEILRYEKYDAKADLWSVGAVLYEMSVGRPPFRAQNHIELLKRIEHAKSTVKFPDEDPANASSEAKPVQPDIKALVRDLLKRHPIERASYDEFFKSKALENSKFRRPEKRKDTKARVESEILPTDDKAKLPWISDPSRGIPEAHRIIPPEVLDPKVNIPPSSFHFRRKDPNTSSHETTQLQSQNIGDPLYRQEPTHRYAKDILNTPQGLVESPRGVVTDLPIFHNENEDDAMQQEYVLVDETKSVEFNRVVDEIRAPHRKVASSPLREMLSPISQPSFPLSRPPVVHSSAYPPAPLPAPTQHTPPSPDHIVSYNTSSRSASNALSRALTKASKKLFGDRESIPRNSSSQRSSTALVYGDDGHDAEEDALLAQLEDLAQKTQVIMRWCGGMHSKILDAGTPGDSLKQKQRWPEAEADCTPMTCILLYMLLMSFSQRGIDSVRAYQDYVYTLDPTENFLLGDGFKSAMIWFRDLFFKCQELVTSLKSQLPQDFRTDTLSVQLLIYNHATQLSRTAARKELLDQMSSADECEKRYEEALWCLYTVRDDLTRQGVSSQEDDQDMVSYEITRTKLRLHRCRLRMKMDDRERIQDARADHNLDDVQRFPAPWEITGSR